MKLSGTVVAMVAIASFAGGVGMSAQDGAAWPWPLSMDAASAAPEVHRVLMENDHVRLLEITLQPGQVEKPHDHRWPSVIVMDAPMGSRDNYEIAGKNRISMEPRFENGDWKTPQVVLLPPQAPHQLTNTSTYPEHFYRLEFKRMDGNSIMNMKEY